MSSTAPQARYKTPLIPSLFKTIRSGYTPGLLSRDLSAGITVGIVAIPLALAFAIASGLTPGATVPLTVGAGTEVQLNGGGAWAAGLLGHGGSNGRVRGGREEEGCRDAASLDSIRATVSVTDARGAEQLVPLRARERDVRPLGSVGDALRGRRAEDDLHAGDAGVAGGADEGAPG